MALSDWTLTQLWQLLESRKSPAELVRTYVRSSLTEVQILLAKGGTAPLDFTLHDDEHAFRVAERIEELIPGDTLQQLSDFEIGLLLQAAYLHDIGMNPRQQIVMQIREYLLTGTKGELDDVEAGELQKWLDETHPGEEPPVGKDLELKARVRRVEFLAAYYGRHRHNDWSEKFILEQASKIGSPPYATWPQDLAALCKSHHFGLQGLMDDSFNLRIAGIGNKLVNLRYLAATLRVADVLEFDPERTPEVVFLHRSIEPGSRIYWYKDHNIVLTLNEKKREILIAARTADAWTHRAVIDTANDVDHELQICATIRDQTGFIRGVKLEGADYYVWPWPRGVARDISPRPNSFVYIDGAFRPDAERVISLLAGTQLYPAPVVAVRELLQNAFDAVKEQLAIEILLETKPADEELLKAHANVHEVALSLEETGNETWLVCSDTGIGMTQRIIENYLLVSGSRPRPETLELQRRCVEKGLKFERSGEFGIGVLSYFMLADKMIIETRPSLDAHADGETHGWRFETEGIDAFGELRAFNRAQRGSIVKLRIRADKKDQLGLISSYLQRSLVKTPCRLTINLTPERSTSPGWVKSANDFVELSIPNWERLAWYWKDRGLMSAKKRREIEELEQSISALKNISHSALRVAGPYIGEFPNRVGSFRIFIPYFELPNGPSLYFLNFDSGCVLTPPGDSDVAAANSEIIESWRGFATVEIERSQFGESHDFVRPHAMMVEMDFVAGANISVDRQSLVFGNKWESIEKFLSERTTEIFAKFVEERGPSIFAALSKSWLETLGKRGIDTWSYWLAEKQGAQNGTQEWRKANFPALVLTEQRSQWGQLQEIQRRCPQFKDVLLPIRGPFRRDLLPFYMLAPTRIAILQETPCLVYENSDEQIADDRVLAEFPSEWSELLLISLDNIKIYNRDHYISQRVTSDVWSRFNVFRKNSDDKELIQKIDTPEFAVAWIFASAKMTAEAWDALRDNFSADFERVFKLAAINETTDFLVWDREHSYNLKAVSNKRAEIVSRNISIVGNALAIPADKKWIIDLNG